MLLAGARRRETTEQTFFSTYRGFPFSGSCVGGILWRVEQEKKKEKIKPTKFRLESYVCVCVFLAVCCVLRRHHCSKE